MPGRLICKVCGNAYSGCRSINTTGAFRWQDVACCPEHGSIYLTRILNARRPKEDSPAAETNDSAKQDGMVLEELNDEINDDINDLENDLENELDYYDEDEDDDWLEYDDEDFGDDNN